MSLMLRHCDNYIGDVLPLASARLIIFHFKDLYCSNFLQSQTASIDDTKVKGLQGMSCPTPEKEGQRDVQTPPFPACCQKSSRKDEFTFVTKEGLSTGSRIDATSAWWRLCSTPSSPFSTHSELCDCKASCSGRSYTDHQETQGSSQCRILWYGLS